MKVKWFDLQLFAEGAGDGAAVGDGGQAAGGNAADAGQDNSIEARLSQLGIPKDKIDKVKNKKGAFKSIPTPPPVEQEAAQPAAETAEVSQGETSGAADRKTWEEIKAEYKEEYDAEMQNMVKKRIKNLQDKIQQLEDRDSKAAVAIDFLANKYGMDPANLDMDQFIEAFRNDASLSEAKAIELGTENEIAHKLELAEQDEARREREKERQQQLKETFDRGGNVVIPSFAVGRTQEMLYFLRKIKVDKLVEGWENFDVYVDSPLAVEATEIFSQNISECYDEEAMELIRAGINPLTFPGLHLSITSEESKAINFDMAPKVILSASGMCEAGRIRHHLKHNLWREECTILFVGYQAIGTLGRALVDGVNNVKLFGELIEVNAHIQVLAGISGHADKNGLTDWVNAFEKQPERVFLVHGEDETIKSFCNYLHDEYGHNTYAPYSGTVFDMLADEFIYEAEPVVLKKKEGQQKRVTEVFARLLAAGNRLLQVIAHNEGGTNKDLAKFADQINSLCDKWDR